MDGESASATSAGGESQSSQAIEGDLSTPNVQESGEAESMELEMELEPDQPLSESQQGQEEAEEGNMDVHLDAAGSEAEQADEMLMEAGPSQSGKRVKVNLLHHSQSHL